MKETNAKAVGQYYDTWTSRFETVYGDTIQAHRPPDLAELHEHTLLAADIQNGHRVLDAGCGVGGPAAYFAQAREIQLEGVTISSVQAEKAQERMTEKGLQDKVRIQQGDYHNLGELFPEASFDRVLFLESYGHSNSKELVLAGATKVLKRGGRILIKGFFSKEPSNKRETLFFEQTRLNMNEAYCYDLPDLYETLKLIGQNALEILYLRRPPYQDDYYQVVNRFQETYQVNLGLQPLLDEETNEVIFPVNFFEICMVKR